MFAEAARSQDREGELDEREIAATGQLASSSWESYRSYRGGGQHLGWREWANEAIVATVPAEIPPAENIHEDPQEGRRVSRSWDRIHTGTGRGRC